MFKKLFRLQAAILLLGTLFAWYTVVTDFIRFYQVEGSIFKIQNCLAPNPVMTPCFYGAWAFLIALIWSFMILKMPEAKQKVQEKRLLILLIAGTLFAWGNFSWGLVKFIQANGQPSVGCSGQIVTNPFATPCFIGALFFTGGLLTSLLIVSKQKRLN